MQCFPDHTDPAINNLEQQETGCDAREPKFPRVKVAIPNTNQFRRLAAAQGIDEQVEKGSGEGQHAAAKEEKAELDAQQGHGRDHKVD